MTTSARETALKSELAVQLVLTELLRAQRKHAPIHSSHEAVGVIDEEFVEFKTEVYAAQFDGDRLEEKAREATELAAMAVRFLVDIVPLDVLKGMIAYTMQRERREQDADVAATAADALRDLGGNG